MVVTDSAVRTRADVFLSSLHFIAIYAFAGALLLQRGITWTILHVFAALLLLRLFFVANGAKFWCSRSFKWFILFVVALFTHGWLAVDGAVGDNYHWNLLGGAVVVLAVGALPEGAPLPRHRLFVAALTYAFIAAQAVTLLVFSRRSGLFSNIHFLSLFADLAVPVLVYLVATATPKFRWLPILALMTDLAIVAYSYSRPAYLALFLGMVVLLPYLSQFSRLSIVAVLVLVPVAVHFTGLFGVHDHVAALLSDISRDERVTLWREAALMQNASSTAQWLMGHGFGQFYPDYRVVSSFTGVDEGFHFPHNFVMEILYSHGMLGVSVTLVALIGLLRRFNAALVISEHNTARPLGLTLLCLVVIHLSHTFLTLPMFSRPGFFSLCLILGASFCFFRRVLPAESLPFRLWPA